MAIDGVHPESGNYFLYVVPDALTSKVLYPNYLYDSRSDNIVSIISVVKEKVDHRGNPIIAFISDHGNPFDCGGKGTSRGNAPFLPFPNHEECMPSHNGYGS